MRSMSRKASQSKAADLPLLLGRPVSEQLIPVMSELTEATRNGNQVTAF